jgi:hypothetical protein
MRNYNTHSRRSKTEARTLRPNHFLAKWQEVEQERSQIGQAVTEQTKQLSTNAVDFFEQILGFKPYAYQKEFAELFENNQFTAARWCRQSGKTETISALLLKYAVKHQNAAICIVGPSWRQTKRIITRITTFAHKLPPGIVFNPQKTQIHFANGSSIEAFPNNPETIRGPTFDVVYCLPSGAKVNLENGTQIPIEQLKPGQSVLSYNLKTGEIEPKRIVRTFRNPRAGRRVMRISHSFGALDCTAEHKIFSLTRGFVDASKLLPDDKILYCKLAFMRCQIKESNVSKISSQNLSEEEESYVYDIEVEDNHNFFADGVLVSNCDEMNFVANDEDLYDAILYTLGTTDGKFVCSSTPWNTDSVFYKIFTHKNFGHFKTSHVTIEKALSPNGPLKPNTIQQIKTQMGDDPSRWKREMEAEWVEDDNVWLTQSLIASCIGTAKNCSEELDPLDPEVTQQGDFFAGLDLAQTKDYTVFSVVERQNESLYLRHLKIFKQPTIYAPVLAYIKALQDRWGGFERIRVDFTREGPSFIADMEAAGIENAEGVNFSVPRKSEMAGLLKQRMQSKRFFYPLLSWERPYPGDICTELNVERYDMRRDGNIGFSHPQGTHDDVFWSIALSVYATSDMAPEPFLAVFPRG